ncbi:hypothetical protein KAI58_04735 [Candidatus Gracilibacteria bacterium]|nr:hypothetical protein [Candidatus Gracilibacteria bacterium]
MKKVLILTISFAVLSGTTFAYSETREDGFENPVSNLGQKSSQQKLNEAIKKRQWYYFKNKFRTTDYKSRTNQQIRRNIGKKEINVNERSTKVTRTGELKDVPFYDDRRELNQGQYNFPNNPKRNFRSRAIDYYVEGGDANKKSMQSGVIYGSTHKVSRIPIRAFTEALGKINLQNRNEIRFIGRKEQVPTGYQSTSFRRGDSIRNFMHPYMRFRD